MSTRTTWPKPHRTKGAALTARQVEDLLGVAHNTVNVWLKRTREGRKVIVQFPEPADTAVPDERRRLAVPYWWEKDIIHFGQKKGILK